MARKVIGPTGSRRRRWLFLVCLVVTIGAGVFFIPGALAVHDTGAFQLDGDASSATQPIGATAPDDWDRVCYEATGDADCGTTSETTGGGGATAVSWTGDCEVGSSGFGCVSNNATIYTGGGSKDASDINNWAWKDASGGLPDKDNLVHAFAARYSLDSTNASGSCPNGTSPYDGTVPCDVIFFGSDRYDNSGDSQQGFWFLQNDIGFGTNKVGGGTGFTSSNDPEFHRFGDLLVLSDFSNGGTTANIKVYEWDTGCLKGVKNPVAGDCADANLRLLAASGSGTSAECSASLPSNDGYCGIVNPSDGTAVPWSSDYTDKSGNNSYLNGEFFEAGVNLSTLGLANECFSTVVSETRSSDSTDAVLKDFVLGSFAPCEASLVTTPGGATAIGSDGMATVSDSATLSVSGLASPPAPTGTVDFYLCGPSDGISSCDDSNSSNLKATINWNTADTSVANEYTINSGNVTVSSAGDYCWYATWDGDENYPNGAVKDDAGECFTISPKSPELTTSATTGPVSPGAEISDTATFTTAPATPSNGTYGTITFSLYGPETTDSETCTDPPDASANRVYQSVLTINGTDTSYNSYDGDGGHFTDTHPGYYYWVATYTPDSGDANNTTATTSCGDTGETSYVRTLQPTMDTAQRFVPNDSATIAVASGAGNLEGHVVFKLYVDDTSCSKATPDYESSSIDIDSGTPNEGTPGLTKTVTSSNETAYDTTGTTFSWVVVYTSDNNGHENVTSPCTNETSSITINNGAQQPAS